MINFENGFILFGGFTENEASKTIARFDLATTSWNKLGELRTPRETHGVVYVDEVFLNIGGWISQRTEKCTLSGIFLNRKSISDKRSTFSYLLCTIRPEDSSLKTSTKDLL